MACRHVKIGTPHGTVGMIICGPRGRTGPKFNCQTCLKREHTKLCDFRPDERTGKTCDRKLCDECAVSIGPDTDHCPNHWTVKKFERRCPKHGGDRANGCEDCKLLDEPGKISREQLELWKKEYGEDSEFYRTRILGQFPTEDKP